MADPKLALYDAPDVDAGRIGAAVEEVCPGLAVEVRDRFVDHHLDDPTEAAAAIAGCRVTNLNERSDVDPLPGEIAYEQRILEDPTRADAAVMYDGEALSAALRELIPADERHLDVAHVVLTPRLVGTFQAGDRYHARVVVCAYPSIVSTTGLVEAPAKPREFYRKRQALSAVGGGQADVHELKEEFEDRFVDHGDPEIPAFLEGYVLQAVAYAFGPGADPFCDDPDCRLYNAHWQEEMIRAQSGGLCEDHKGLLSALAT